VIPSNITIELAALQTAVNAALPLNAAPRATIKALQLSSDQLLSDIQAAQYTLAGGLDTWVAPVDAGAIIAGLLGVYENAVDEANITQMRGVIGRVTSNLNQIP
jgi:hypothetical protein